MLNIDQIIKFYCFIQLQFQMLKYRQFLQQSRALRGYRDSPTKNGANSRQFIRQSQSIKNLVSQPNYGQIFYGDSKKPNMGIGLQQAIKTQKQTKQEMVKYLNQLEQENLMLKTKLSEVLSQISPNNSDHNIPSNPNIISPQSNNLPQLDPPYLSPSIPSQQKIVEIPSQNSIPSPTNRNNSFKNERNQNQNFKNYPPQNSNTLISNKYRQQSLPISEEPQFLQNGEQRGYESYPQQYQAVYPSNPQIYGGNSPFPSQNYINTAIPYQEAPQQQRYEGEFQRLYDLARQRLNQIKDDDEQLRNYTIKLLKKPR